MLPRADRAYIPREALGILASRTLANSHPQLLALLRPGQDVLDVGCGPGTLTIETARRVTSRPIPAVGGARRPGDPAFLVASSERAKTELGWKPSFASLDTIVGTAWQFKERRPQGFR